RQRVAALGRGRLILHDLPHASLALASLLGLPALGDFPKIILTEFEGASLAFFRPHGRASQRDECYHDCPSHRSVSLKQIEQRSTTTNAASFPFTSEGVS